MAGNIFSMLYALPVVNNSLPRNLFLTWYINPKRQLACAKEKVKEEYACPVKLVLSTFYEILLPSKW